MEHHNHSQNHLDTISRTENLRWAMSEVPNELSLWGRRWVQYLCEQYKLSQAWLAYIDGEGRVRWISNWPPKVLHSPFPLDSLQLIVGGGSESILRATAGTGRYGLIPLQHDGHTIGLIGLFDNNGERFGLELLDNMRALSSIMAQGLFHEFSRDRLDKAEYSINHLLQSSLDATNVLTRVLSILADALNADAAIVSVRQPAGSRLNAVAVHGMDESLPLLAGQTEEWEMSGKVVLDEKQPIWIEDLHDGTADQDPIHRMNKTRFRGYLAIPLIGRNEPSGVLEILWREKGRREFWEGGFLERTTRQISLTMERSGLLKDLRQASQDLLSGYNAVFEGLSRIMGLRDHETEEHTLRVSQLTMRLVEHMHLPIEHWEAIRRGALLHDIGKLGIPDAILLKPGSLTDAEREMMQLHVLYGYNILSPITSSRPTLDIILHHHEHWDGNGYPDGLKGTQIPLAARLFSVVDVFDALTADRPYRTAWRREQALDYIREQSGTQFDPSVVKAFLEITELN
jgi:putative nucleotidyltransferase with HDIG domain